MNNMNNVLMNEECIVCLDIIKNETFSKGDYIIIPNCYCIYNIHYSCLLNCIKLKNKCLICEKPFNVYKKPQTLKSKIKKFLCCF